MAPRTIPRADASNGDVSPFVLAASMLRNLPLLLGVPLVMAVAAAGLTIVRGSDFRATSVLQPRVEASTASRMTAFAAQFGFSGLGTQSGETIQYYAKVIGSRELLRAVVTSAYQLDIEAGGSSQADKTLVDLYGITGETEEGRTRAAMGRLARSMSVSTSIDAGLITLRTDAPSPALAVMINRRFIELLNDFNIARRQSRIATERAFVEERLQEARAALTSAEERLEAFLRNNRTYATSPQLAFEAGRLERDVDMRQQVFVSLAQAYEQARIDEVRNTPSISVVDAPEGSAVRLAAPLRRGAWGFIIGVIVAVGILAARSYLQARALAYPEEYQELREAGIGTVRRLLSRGRLQPQ